MAAPVSRTSSSGTLPPSGVTNSLLPPGSGPSTPASQPKVHFDQSATTRNPSSMLPPSQQQGARGNGTGLPPPTPPQGPQVGQPAPQQHQRNPAAGGQAPPAAGGSGPIFMPPQGMGPGPGPGPQNVNNGVAGPQQRPPSQNSFSGGSPGTGPPPPPPQAGSHQQGGGRAPSQQQQLTREGSTGGAPPQQQGQQRPKKGSPTPQELGMPAPPQPQQVQRPQQQPLQQQAVPQAGQSPQAQPRQQPNPQQGPPGSANNRAASVPLAPAPAAVPEVDVKLVAKQAAEIRAKDQKIKLLTEHFNHLSKHNTQLSDDFVRIRLVLESYRSIVTNEIRPDAMHIKNDLLNLRSIVHFQGQQFNADFKMLGEAVAALGEVASGAAAASHDEKENRGHERRGGGGSRQSRREFSHYSESDEDRDDIEPMIPKRLLDAVTVEKLLLEERVERLEQEHHRHTVQLKSLHKEREATLLSQLNLLSSVADHRDKEEAAVVALSHHAFESDHPNSSGQQPPRGSAGGGGHSHQQHHQNSSSGRYRSQSPPQGRPRNSGGGRASSVGRREQSVDTRSALWADRVLRDRHIPHANYGGGNDGGRGSTGKMSSSPTYGQRHAQQRLIDKKTRQENFDSGRAPRVSGLDHYSRQASSQRNSPVRQMSISRR